MTVEEIEIIVTAKVEEALKEFQKIMPTIKQTMKQAQEAFSKVDTKTMTNKLHQAVQFMKKKVQDLKKSSENNEIAIKVNNKDAQKQISQIQKEIDSLQKKISEREIKLNITNGALDKIRNDTRQSVINDMPDAGAKRTKQHTEFRLYQNQEYVALEKQSDKLNAEIIRYNTLLESAKTKIMQLQQETNKTATTQNKLSSFFNVFKQKLDQTTGDIGKVKNIFSQLPSIAQNMNKIIKRMTNNIKGMRTGLKQGLKHVLRYAMALFSLRGIYSVLSNSANSWLSSQNAQAKQLSANIEYMKYAMGSAFAPIIEYVIGLVYQLMKAIQSLIYAFSGINIFAKATAKSMNSTANSAGKASKSLAGVHNEINNVSDNDGGSGSASPNLNLSQLDSQMNPLSQKLYDFFKPLVDSWKIYSSGLIEQIKITAGQVRELISSVWGSFENIITNGTIYFVLENILTIIGNISEAFANAWINDGNGDAIIQSLANALNNLLGAINNVVQSESFQNWLNNCSNKFREISEKISEIDWQPLINALSDIGQNLGNIALDILSGLVDIFKWLVENPIVAEILLGIAIAIGVLSTAYSIWATVTGILTTVSTALNIAILPLIGIIVAIIAVIALIVVAIMNWDTIIKALKDTWEWIKQKAIEIWNAIANFFKNLWQGICDVATKVWNKIVEAISNVINGIKNTISKVLNAIKTVWNNIWNGIKNVVSTVWNGIWSCIKGVINSILWGIESFVNGTIKGINKILSGISKVASAVGSLIGLDPINLQLSMISLPRLAKGGVLTEATAVVAGEYSGAKSNPEIVTPQNIMRETIEDVLSGYQFNNNPNGEIKQLVIQFGSQRVALEMENLIRQAHRRNGTAYATI